MIRTLFSLPNLALSWLEPYSTASLSTLARFIFAAVLLVYYLNSGSLKLGEGLDGLWNPTLGAYAAILPKQMEAVGFDISQLSSFHHAIVILGTVSEFVLPVLVVIGLFTRAAALGMIGFVVVQSLTDLFGHGGIEHKETLGVWFDNLPDGVILDQRAFWVFLLLFLVFRGAGPLSLDRLFRSEPSLRQDDPLQ